MSATTPMIASLTDFLGGGFSVKTRSGSGFSTIYDPATGSYKTSINTGGVSVAAAGAGQSPVGVWQTLTTTSSGNFFVFAIVGLVIILIVSGLRGR